MTGTAGGAKAPPAGPDGPALQVGDKVFHYLNGLSTVAVVIDSGAFVAYMLDADDTDRYPNRFRSTATGLKDTPWF